MSEKTATARDLYEEVRAVRNAAGERIRAWEATSEKIREKWRHVASFIAANYRRVEK